MDDQYRGRCCNEIALVRGTHNHRFRLGRLLLRRRRCVYRLLLGCRRLGRGCRGTFCRCFPSSFTPFGSLELDSADTDDVSLSSSELSLSVVVVSEQTDPPLRDLDVGMASESLDTELVLDPYTARGNCGFELSFGCFVARDEVREEIDIVDSVGVSGGAVVEIFGIGMPPGPADLDWSLLSEMMDSDRGESSLLCVLSSRDTDVAAVGRDDTDRVSLVSSTEA
jgi:hypothetical protein